MDDQARIPAAVKTLLDAGVVRVPVAVRELLAKAGFERDADFARAIGLSTGEVSKMIGGRRPASRRFVAELAKRFGGTPDEWRTTLLVGGLRPLTTDREPAGVAP